MCVPFAGTRYLLLAFFVIVACKEFPDLDDPSFLLGQEEEVEATRRRRSQA